MIKRQVGRKVKSRVKCHDRLIIHGKIFSIDSYCKGKRRNDSVVTLKSGVVVRLKKVIHLDGQIFIFAQEQLTLDQCFSGVAHIMQHTDGHATRLFTVQEIHRKCVVVKANNKSYVCKQPNIFEVD